MPYERERFLAAGTGVLRGLLDALVDDGAVSGVSTSALLFDLLVLGVTSGASTASALGDSMTTFFLRGVGAPSGSGESFIFRKSKAFLFLDFCGEKRRMLIEIQQ